MSITIDVVYDGETLRPREPLSLTPNRHYSVTIEDAPTQPEKVNAWSYLASLAGSYDGPPDWSAEHDHYIYGTPKRGSEENV
jgi:hypothetical protein